MPHLETFDAVTPMLAREAVELVATVEGVTGRRPLSDQQWLDLTVGGRSPLLTEWRDGDRLLGVALASPANASWTLETVVPTDLPRGDRLEVATQLVRGSLAAIADQGGHEAHWWIFEEGDELVDVATALGLRAGRELHQMRVPLPLSAELRPDPVPVRGFVVGEDEADWLEVNNAAFADHPEQGGWTMETVRQREADGWFEPEGFLLHHRDGRLAAFCWTKIHREERPPAGEIYVIAVHPDFAGLRLGNALTVAGLDSIVARGVTTGMLYVDRGNEAAYQMYRRLGFTTHHVDRAFVAHLEGASA